MYLARTNGEIPDDVKEEITEALKKNQTVYLATIDDNVPRVRPVTLVYLADEFWVLTDSKSGKIKQIMKNPNIELCYTMGDGKDVGYVRFSGKAKIMENKEIKEKIAKKVGYFKTYWKGSDDPNFTLLRIKAEEVDYMRVGEIEGERFRNR